MESWLWELPPLLDKGCQMSTHVGGALLEPASLQSVHYQFCCRINGAIDQWQTCVSCRMADQSPTAEPGIRAPINTTTVGMIVDTLGLSGWRPRGYSFLLQQASINRWGGCSRCNKGGASKVEKRGVKLYHRDYGPWFHLMSGDIILT